MSYLCIRFSYFLYFSEIVHNFAKLSTDSKGQSTREEAAGGAETPEWCSSKKGG